MNLLRRINAACLVGAGLCILAMTLLGGSDVIVTALAHRPIAGTYEATETLMVGVIFLSLGYLQIEGGNIAMDIVPKRLSPRGRILQAMLCELIALGYFGALTWQAWLMATESFSINEYSAGLVAFPLYPAKFVVAFGAAMTSLCCLARLFNVRALVHSKPPVAVLAETLAESVDRTLAETPAKK